MQEENQVVAKFVLCYHEFNVKLPCFRNKSERELYDDIVKQAESIAKTGHSVSQ